MRKHLKRYAVHSKNYKTKESGYSVVSATTRKAAMSKYHRLHPQRGITSIHRKKR